MPSDRERGSPARGLMIGQSRGSEKHAGVERREAYWSAAARDCGKAREKNHSHERDKRETHVCSRNTSRAQWRKALSGLDGYRVRGRCGAHVEHDEQRNVHARTALRTPVSLLLPSCAHAAHYEFGSRGSLICRRVGSVEQKQASMQSSHRSC